MAGTVIGRYILVGSPVDSLQGHGDAVPERQDGSEEPGVLGEPAVVLPKGHRLGDKRLKAVAQKYGKSVPQILIRWGLQQGIIEIPKSAKPDHIKENAAVFDFEIRPEAMRALDSLSEDLHVAWDPTDEP